MLCEGPGTEKTLTAKSIAEEQERPLYIVAGGEIGTEPTGIEKQKNQTADSNSTLMLCWSLVRLDEADTTSVLKYHDGFVILSTDRVGIFGEVFKSLIQLALGYSNLDENQRKKIWSNYIRNQRRQIRNMPTMARHLAMIRSQMLTYQHILHAVELVTEFKQYLE
ncbi:uncharacterized protein BCR38DRAFT_468884 [Pseudomassariella vexata]|uniref:ATPase AAA-type core domain-containing protein n=1 Tax=Pseudomassariella vexata TaxID=1141098 RepID=A0A1Y2DGA8_9PEZI|nr:uncharacterized protein BCR38DRAFT_468884 [Pseudomassariella vexata]ORY57725.1 hypothetical protein BCR38DRAFT_468884 [Pseudomassariella vexata]